MRKTWWIVIMMLIILGCPSSPSLTAIKIYRFQWYEKHDMRILKKWMDLAVKETETNPTNCLGWFFLGEAYINLGEQLASTDTLMKGAGFVKKGFSIDSAKVLKELQVNREGYWAIFKDVTDRLIKKEDYKTAKEFLNITSTILPERAENYAMYGFLALKDGDTTKAIKLYGRAIKLDPQNPNAYSNLGRIYSTQNLSDSSKYYFSKADSLMDLNLNQLVKMVVPGRDISEIKTPVIKASILLEDKKEAEAKKVLAQFGITDLEPKKRVLNNLTSLRYDIGSLLFQIGLDEFQRKNLEEAAKRFNSVLEVVPKHSNARFNSGLIEYQLKKYEVAEKEFKILAEQKPDDFRAWFYLGATIAQQKRYQDAIEPFEKAAEINPKNPDTYRNLALMYSKIGEKKKAVEYYKKAQELEKGDK